MHTLEGTGLGLSIVHNIVNKHDSTICLSSTVGEGSTFWFDLGIFSDRCDLPEPKLNSRKFALTTTT